MVHKNRKTLGVLLLAVTIAVVIKVINTKAPHNTFPLTQRVDNLQEWIKLGPRPLIDISLTSGEKNLFVSIL